MLHILTKTLLRTIPLILYYLYKHACPSKEQYAHLSVGMAIRFTGLVSVTNRALHESSRLSKYFFNHTLHPFRLQWPSSFPSSSPQCLTYPPHLYDILYFIEILEELFPVGSDKRSLNELYPLPLKTRVSASPF